jgi:hypothetical protein
LPQDVANAEVPNYRTFHYNQHTAKNQHCNLTQPKN